jgi:hypothetical protein
MNDVLRGSRAAELPRANRTYAEGRVCDHDGCDTRLSVYNRSRHCWQHAELKFPVIRGDRKKKNKQAAA